MSQVFNGVGLGPRAHGRLLVLIVARISTVHQDVRSLDDQVALCTRYVKERYDGEVAFEIIQGQGSGEILDRRDLARAEEEVGSRRYDLVVVEDLGRICRRSRANDFLEHCEDSETRMIAINDSIDTAQEGWRTNAFFASFKHESSNSDTAKRIRRSLRHRFTLGGVIQCLPYGYEKPVNAANDSEITKSPGASEIYEEWFSMLERGASFAEVANWLNAKGVAPGRWVKASRWNGQMVGQVTRNPILKGVRRRNQRMSKRVNKTGRRKSVKAPPGEQLLRQVPHLAFIDPVRYDLLMVRLAERNAGYARGAHKRVADCRAGVPRKRTTWPGQHVECDVCGRVCYWSQQKTKKVLMCSGAKNYMCWNGASFDGDLAARKTAAAVLDSVESLTDFDEALRARVQQAINGQSFAREAELQKLRLEEKRLGIEIDRLVDTVARMGHSEAIAGRLAQTEEQRDRLRIEIAALQATPVVEYSLPSVAELKQLARESLADLRFDDPEFARVMSALVPKITVLPYRARDCGRIVLRANLTIDLASLTGKPGSELTQLLTRHATVEFYDRPSRMMMMERALIMRDKGVRQRDIASEFGLTQPIVQQAFALDQMMTEAGSSDPYVAVISPPDNDGKIRRHRHPMYTFQPQAGFPIWETTSPPNNLCVTLPASPVDEPTKPEGSKFLQSA